MFIALISSLLFPTWGVTYSRFIISIDLFFNYMECTYNYFVRIYCVFFSEVCTLCRTGRIEYGR